MTIAPDSHRPVPVLTTEQATLLKLRAAGRSRARIARALYTSESQITDLLNQLQAALGAESRAQLIGLGLIHRIVSPQDVIVRHVSVPIPLTPRQRQVLTIFATGGNDQDAATALGITTSTVREYASKLLSNLGARDRAHAVGLGLVYEVLLLSDLNPALPAVTLTDHLAQFAANT
ncbi:helix-turn-helix transcriptional regulator [Kitasatospora acidiphila]|uniref:Helix-turn-helix transcriptional regulator n=1 Tax=Kitasatospora acidiphila TaxID=2567942 RepID=A0A540VZ20_9ACTN|nr:LuxR C-terminal-related transcriptional regulator [Kitasatospora acidiphila]TQF01977.1 helix-turn-helix transcriptional regulator [Kitasatospora acidiphila]TQF07998.1 helix-turn-helix transcriptional regulator [Kitasatospora acidiphila]